jgi:hypothetical protein
VTVWRLARKAVTFELGLYRSLLRWVFRRPDVPGSGSEAYAYAGAVTPLLLVFIAVSAIDIPVLHVLLPWRTAQLVSLAVGIWGLTWMVGLLASLRVHPHVVGAAGLRVRYGTSVDITLPWDTVSGVRVRNRNLPTSRTVQLERSDTGVVLNIAITSQTNVDIVLSEPREFPVKGRMEEVAELRFFADDPRAVVAATRDRLGAVNRG